MSENRTLKMALALAKAGFLVFPCRQHDRRPATINGFKDATTDERQIRTWFANDRQFNLAMATGKQPNGLNVVAIDVDAHNGGLESWDAWSQAHDVPSTARHETPSSGFHLFFDAPVEVPNGASRVGSGVDVRGTGGYVVVPPSVAPSKLTGELLAYATQRAQFVGTAGTVAPMPVDLLAECQPPSTNGNGHRAGPLPLVDTGDSVADLARVGWDWYAELEADGWTLARRHGTESHWTRPDKDRRQGSSAVLHEDRGGPLVTFSTSLPVGGAPAAGAAIGSFSPWDYIVTFRCGGDTRIAASLVRRQSAPPAAAVGTLQETPEVAPALPSGFRLPVVGEAYWQGSARNRHIFQAARASMVSPDALDLVMFALQSTLIPPGYLLPRIIGGKQPLNFLACLVAPTGVFKTSTLDAARDLIGAIPPWVVQLGMGSGEGIGATFLKEQTEVNAKTGKAQKTGLLVRNDIRAAFFEADEGSGLSEQARRQGATIIANLCKAWSGSTLGEANAEPSKRRLVLNRDYRIAALVNIQPAVFAHLFTAANTSTGLTGRFMFSGTADYDIPDETPPHPGELEMPIWPSMPLTLEIAPSIVAEATAKIRERHRTATLDTQIDAVGQNAAVVARMAGIAVLCDDRRTITEDDWALAGMRAATSAACLDTLAKWSTVKKSDAHHTALEAQVRDETVVTELKERQGIARMAESIRRHVDEAAMARGKLARAVSSSSTRDRFEPALRLAIANGWVRVVEDSIERV